MDTFSLLFSAPSPKVEKTIEVNLEDLEQFFNTMDPSPFHEKDLEHDLEEFIVSWATEYSLHDPLRLVVYLQNRSPGTDAQSVIERAVHNYFAYRTGLNQREFKQLLREGRISLLIGLLFLTVCLSGGQMASRLDIPGANIVETSLTIAGWVAMWHPMDVFFMDGGHCAGRARFIANSALSQSKSDIPLYQERRANFLSTPADENKRCGCLAVYLEPLLLKKYVEHIHLLF
jgi:hypothetical protein